MKNKILLYYPLVDKNKQIPNLPFSILNIERVIRDLPVKVYLVDERVDENVEKIIDKYKDEWLLIGISAMIGYQMISGKELSQYVKQKTDAPIAWGGWFANVLPEVALKENFIDIVVIGQGETAFRDLVIAMLHNHPLSSIKGIGYKENKKIIINPKSEIVDEKTFPLVNFDSIDVDKIIKINDSFSNNNRSINYIATYGCPYSCSFCCLTTIWGQRTYTKEIDVIIDDITLLINKHKVSKISFDDDHFFGNKKFVFNLTNKLLEENISFYWEANAHISHFLRSYTLEDLKRFKEAGCRSIRFGAESGDQEVLDKVNKKLKVGEIFEIAKLMKDAQIKCVFYIIVAFPWNPTKDFNSTLKMLGKAKLLNPELEVAINFLFPLPGTPIYEESKKHGFKGQNSFDEILEVYFNLFVAPWWKKNYRLELYDFIWVYFKFANPNHYKNTENAKLMKFANKVLYPFCYIRLKYNIRGFRFEAKIYFLIRRIGNFFSDKKMDDEREQLLRCRSWKR